MRINLPSAGVPLNTATSLLNVKARNARTEPSTSNTAAATAVKPGQLSHPDKCGPCMSGDKKPAAGKPVAATFSPAPPAPAKLDGEGNTGNVVHEITAAPGVPAPPAGGEVTLAGFNKAWGTDNSQYDLDGNGTVNMDDMLSFINTLASKFESAAPEQPVLTEGNSLQSAPPVLSDSSVSPVVNATLGVESVVAPPATEYDAPAPTETPTLAGILSAWGQNNATFDLNGSGTVDMDDVLQFINGMPAPPTLSVAKPTFSPAESVNTLAAASTASPSLRKANLQKLTDSLVDRLGNAGFQNQPPTNIRQLVSSLNLSTADSNQLLGNISKRYPAGLGVNVVG